MPEKYEVIWAETAENDLIKIIGYIAQSSPDNALNILSKIKTQVSTLSTFPEKCRIVPELQDHGIDLYRDMLIAPWRVFYRIFDYQVFVLSVIDSRQNIEDILLKRLTQHIF